MGGASHRPTRKAREVPEAGNFYPILWFVLGAVIACPALCLAATAPEQTPRQFENLFGEEVRRTLSRGTPDQRGQLAEQIFLEARSRAEDPPFVAQAMEAVIRLASDAPTRGGLAYAAWQSLKNFQLRPPIPCLEQMMALAPRVPESLEPGPRGYWLTEVWLRDAMELAGLYCDAGEYGKAREVLVAVRSAAQRLGIVLRPDVEDNIRGLERLQPADAVSRAILLAREENWPAAQACLNGVTTPGAAELLQALAAAQQQRPRTELLSQLAAAATALRLPSLVDRVLQRGFSRAGTDALGHIVDQTFYGTPLVGARKIVFVIDFSGSMTPKLASAKEELKRALGSLTADQVFHVIFFHTGAAEMPDGPMPATEENKQKARDFIDRQGAGGGTNPTQALEIALRLGPDTLNMLTDGEFDPVIANVVDQLNPEHRTRINTFCLFSARGAPVLRTIAERHRGTFKFVGQ